MWTKREHIIFWAGAFGFHTLSHVMIQFSSALPIQFWGITLTYNLNMFAIIGSTLITIALLWWASRTK